ncbi:MAG: hypothetical protein JSS20_07235 [Proteobacteria bacterium]|nr:hypothetical protein [Pseudomonadota bacterium]
MAAAALPISVFKHFDFGIRNAMALQMMLDLLSGALNVLGRPRHHGHDDLRCRTVNLTEIQLPPVLSFGRFPECFAEIPKAMKLDRGWAPYD